MALATLIQRALPAGLEGGIEPAGGAFGTATAALQRSVFVESPVSRFELVADMIFDQSQVFGV